MRFFIVCAVVGLVGCGGSVDLEGAGGAGGAGGVGGVGGASSCDGYLLVAGDERVVGYSPLVELEPGQDACLAERPACLYSGGVKVPDNVVGRGTTADPANPSTCAPAS